MMLESTERESLRNSMKIAWIIWGAMLGALALYLLLCGQLGQWLEVSLVSDAPLALLKSILYGVAAFELLVAFFMRRSMLEVRGGIRAIKPHQLALTSNTPPAVARYISAVLVSLAIAESIGIYGLILFLLGGGFKTLYSFLLASAVAIFFFRPKFDELERLAIAMKTRESSGE